MLTRTFAGSVPPRPLGRYGKRVKKVLEYYEAQSEEEAVAEDEN
jgi:hypothetical protein